MALELANKNKQYLKKYADALGLKLSPKLSREKMYLAVETALIKRQVEIEEKERLKLTQAKMKTQRDWLKAAGKKIPKEAKPSLETIMIEKSPKVFVEFINLENPRDEHGNPGASLEFDAGEKYHFKLFDGRKHVMPECIVSKDKKYVEVSRAIRCQTPVYAQRKTTSGDVVSVQVNTNPRFRFLILGPAPDDAEFGFYDDNKYKEKIA
jgi:hypothetical protein